MTCFSRLEGLRIREFSVWDGRFRVRAALLLQGGLLDPSSPSQTLTPIEAGDEF